MPDVGDPGGGVARRRFFFRMRLAILVSILFAVLCYAWIDYRRRRARNAWDHTLDVAIVAVRNGPVDDASFAAMRARLPVLEEQLYEQLRRYRSPAVRPFAFTLAGPIDMDRRPPNLESESIWDAIVYSYRLWRYAHDCDARAGVDSGAFDTRIYLAARVPSAEERKMVEGSSQQRGRLGTVEVELDPTMVDFALFVVSHELMHTLGANDKYLPSGRTMIPHGLAEPSLVPLFPQRYADVMARNRPVAAGSEVPPANLDELGVGPASAAEIGWIQGD